MCTRMAELLWFTCKAKEVHSHHPRCLLATVSSDVLALRTPCAVCADATVCTLVVPRDNSLIQHLALGHQGAIQTTTNAVLAAHLVARVGAIHSSDRVAVKAAGIAILAVGDRVEVRAVIRAWPMVSAASGG
jgi:hypothetical protein